jgi:hypothetical protein
MYRTTTSVIRQVGSEGMDDRYSNEVGDEKFALQFAQKSQATDSFTVFSTRCGSVLGTNLPELRASASPPCLD